VQLVPANMQLSTNLLLSFIYLAPLAQAVPNHPHHDAPVLKIRQSTDPPSAPPPRAGRSSSLSPEYWQRVMTRIRNHGNGPPIADMLREGRPRFQSVSTGNEYRGVGGVLQLQVPGHLAHPNGLPASPSLSNGRPHINRRTPKNDESHRPPNLPPNALNTPNTPREYHDLSPSPYSLRLPSQPQERFLGLVTVRPTTSIDDEIYHPPSPLQALDPLPRVDIAPTPGMLPPALGRNPTALLRISQAATAARLPNPNGSPGFNPIDPAAAEYPILQSRDAKNLDDPLLGPYHSRR